MQAPNMFYIHHLKYTSQWKIFYLFPTQMEFEPQMAGDKFIFH